MMGPYYPHGTLLSSRAGIPECRNTACGKIHLHRTSFLYPLSWLNAISIKNEWREYKEEHVARRGSKIMILKVIIQWLSLCVRHYDKSLTKLSHWSLTWIGEIVIIIIYNIHISGKYNIDVRQVRIKREQAWQSVKKKKFIRGKTKGWLALEQNRCPPFLMESFLYPTNEKFSEEMVHF